MSRRLHGIGGKPQPFRPSGAEWRERRPEGGYTQAGDPGRCARPVGTFWAIYRYPDALDRGSAKTKAARECPPTTVLVAVAEQLGAAE